MCVVTGTGGSSSASAAVGVCQCDGCALSPEPVELLVCTGPWGGGAPLWGTAQERDMVRVQTLTTSAAWFSSFTPGVDLCTCIKVFMSRCSRRREMLSLHTTCCLQVQQRKHEHWQRLETSNHSDMKWSSMQHVCSCVVCEYISIQTWGKVPFLNCLQRRYLTIQFRSKQCYDEVTHFTF